MRNPSRPGRHPYVLVMLVRWPDGTTTRHEMTRYARADPAIRAAKAVRAAWSAMLGAWHWPPPYLVVDSRTGHTLYPANPTEGSASDGDEESTTGRLF